MFTTGIQNRYSKLTEKEENRGLKLGSLGWTPIWSLLKRRNVYVQVAKKYIYSKLDTTTK